MGYTQYINGYKVHPFRDRNTFLTYLQKLKLQSILVALNAEKLMKNDAELRQLVNENVGYPDGIGAVLALRKRGRRSIRIPGVEFWLDIIKHFYDEKSFYIVGGRKEVLQATVSRLRKEFEGINIVNSCNGYTNDIEQQKLIEDIAEKEPDIIFVAMGSPKQERLIKKMYEKHPALYMGLGGSFDIYSGFKKRAPLAFQKLGLEWLYRLLKEPTRIKRQFQLLRFGYHFLTKKYNEFEDHQRGQRPPEFHEGGAFAGRVQETG